MSRVLWLLSAFLLLPVGRAFADEVTLSFVANGDTYAHGTFSYAFGDGYPGENQTFPSIYDLFYVGQERNPQDYLLVTDRCALPEFSIVFGIYPCGTETPVKESFFLGVHSVGTNGHDGVFYAVVDDQFYYDFDVSVRVVPNPGVTAEPSTLALLGTGMLTLVGRVRRRQLN